MFMFDWEFTKLYAYPTPLTPLQVLTGPKERRRTALAYCEVIFCLLWDKSSALV